MNQKFLRLLKKGHRVAFELVGPEGEPCDKCDPPHHFHVQVGAITYNYSTLDEAIDAAWEDYGD
jgi:hypothetical protein